MMNLLVRPLGTPAAHVTPAGRERAPLSQAVRVLLKTHDRPVLVESIRQDENGFFTGEICSPGARGRGEAIQFREQHVFTYETAEDLEKRRATHPKTPNGVPRFDAAQLDIESLKAEPEQEHIPAFRFKPIPEQHSERSATTIEGILHPPPRRRFQRSAVGAVCAAFVIGGAMGYMLPRKAKSPAIAVQVKDGEPAQLRLDYELKKP